MENKIVGIYLAAGMGTRFGGNKLLIPFDGKTLGAHGLITAFDSNLDKIIVVVNKRDPLDWIPTNMMKDEKLLITYCEHSLKGQSYSVKCGIKQANAIGAHNIVILLSDQPLVSVELINQLMTYKEEFPSLKFVATKKDDNICPPVLINKKLTPQLMRISGDIGAKEILKREEKHGKLVEVDNQYELFDIDTQGDYQKALSTLEEKNIN